MRISVEKLPHGAIKIDITHDTAKKPVSFVIQGHQVGAVTQMIAQKMDTFKFQIEL